jgi:molybdopterin converting factor small subunit
VIKVEARLFATLAAYLPGGESSTATVELPDEATVGALVRLLGIPEDLPRVTLVNGLNAEADQELHSGDVVSLFPPLAGGSSCRPN